MATIDTGNPYYDGPANLEAVLRADADVLEIVGDEKKINAEWRAENRVAPSVGVSLVDVTERLLENGPTEQLLVLRVSILVHRGEKPGETEHKRATTLLGAIRVAVLDDNTPGQGAALNGYADHISSIRSTPEAYRIAEGDGEYVMGGLFEIEYVRWTSSLSLDR